MQNNDPIRAEVDFMGMINLEWSFYSGQEFYLPPRLMIP